MPGNNLKPAMPAPRTLYGLTATLAAAAGLVTPACGGGPGCFREYEALRLAMSECPCEPQDEPAGDSGVPTSGAGDSVPTSGADGYDGDDSGGDDSAGASSEGCGRIARRAEQIARSCECGGDDGETGTSGSDTSGSDTGDACVDTPTVLYLSADDSNSMSSPVQARAAALGQWKSLAAIPLRPWEFFNYYDFAYPPAPAGELRVAAEMRRRGDADDQFTLQIGVSSEAIAASARPPVNLTFVLDTSGSMNGHPIAMLRAVCRAVAGQLHPGDIVSMVTWNTENLVVLAGHAVSGADDPDLLAAIDTLSASGGTDLNAGLVAGYDLASAHAKPGRLSRVILVTDGGANVDVTDEHVIAAHAGAADQDGIYLVGVGVGTPGNYNDVMLDVITDVGKGASVFIIDEPEAERMFGDRFVNTLMIAARDIQVRLDMPPGFSIVRFSGEEYSADPSEVEPQHIAPNDAMVFHQQLQTCAPELVTPEATMTVTASYLDALTFEPHEVSITRTFDELFKDNSPRLNKGAAMLAYTDALTALRIGDPNAPALVAAAIAAVEDAKLLLPDDPVLGELHTILLAL